MRFLFLILIIGLLFSCDQVVHQQETSDPAAVVTAFFEAMKTEDLSKAKSYLSENSRLSFTAFESNLSIIVEERRTALLAPFKLNIQQVNCSSEGGTTFCSVCCSEEGDIRLEMTQVNEQWFIQEEFGF